MGLGPWFLFRGVPRLLLLAKGTPVSMFPGEGAGNGCSYSLCSIDMHLKVDIFLSDLVDLVIAGSQLRRRGENFGAEQGSSYVISAPANSWDLQRVGTTEFGLVNKLNSRAELASRESKPARSIYRQH